MMAVVAALFVVVLRETVISTMPSRNKTGVASGKAILESGQSLGSLIHSGNHESNHLPLPLIAASYVLVEPQRAWVLSHSPFSVRPSLWRVGLI